MPKKTRTSIEVTCRHCRKTFFVWPCRAAAARFCSIECHKRDQARSVLTGLDRCADGLYGRKKPCTT